MKAVATEDEVEVLRGTAEVFAALGDVVRLRVLVKLSGGVSCSIAELTEGTGMTRQSVAKHLRVMEQAGLVEARVTGREKLYALDPGSLGDAVACLDMASQHWNGALGRLKGALEK